MKHREALIKVFRFNPEKDYTHRYEKYIVPLKEGMSILEALRYIYENYDNTLAFRDYACKTNQCGMCVIQANGRPVFACNTKLEKEVTIEPLFKFPVIKDLIVDFGKREKIIRRI